MNSWKHDTWWFAASFAFVCGISLGGYICSLWEGKQLERHYVQTVYEPAPCHDYTSEMHELAILREAASREQEFREAKNYFARESKSRMGQYRLEQQRCLEEQEAGK